VKKGGGKKGRKQKREDTIEPKISKNIRKANNRGKRGEKNGVELDVRGGIVIGGVEKVGSLGGGDTRKRLSMTKKRG